MDEKESEAAVQKKMMIIKRLEMSFLICIGVFFLIPGCYFAWGYLQKRDYINSDSYNLFDNVYNKNKIMKEYADKFRNEEISIDGSKCRNVVVVSSVPGNTYFESIAHAFLSIPKRPDSANYSVKQCILSDPEEESSYNFKMSNQEGSSEDFHIPARRYIPNPERPSDDLLYEGLKNISLYYISFDSVKTFAVRDLVYQLNYDDMPELRVYDAQSPESYGYPDIEDYESSYAGVIIVIVSAVLVVVFIWRCWSVRYALMQSQINSATKG